jgi:hypothetical protein
VAAMLVVNGPAAPPPAPPPPPPVAPPPGAPPPVASPPPPVASSITITRAELNAGQLRLEGQGASPNATITANGQVLGTADGAGVFAFRPNGFSAPTCQATVSDGSSSTTTPLAGC